MKKFTLKTLQACLLFAAGSVAVYAAEAQKTDSLIVGVYGGDWEKSIRKAGLDDWAKENNVKLTVVSGADAEWFAKLRAGHGRTSPWDVLIFQPDTVQRASAAGLLQPLDVNKIPNLAKLYPSVQERFTSDSKVWAAGFSLGQLGLAYRTDLVKTPPTSWMDLWKPEYKGHVAISSPTYSAGLQFFSGIVHALGGELDNAQAVDKAFDKLSELRDNAVAFPDSPGAIQTLLERGDAWIVPFWDGRVFALKQSGMKIDFVYPKEGAVVGAANWVIPKGAKNLVNAENLVNALSGAKIQSSFADMSLYGMANSETQYSPELKAQVKVGEEYYKHLVWIDYRTATPKLAEWTQRWSQALGGGR